MLTAFSVAWHLQGQTRSMIITIIRLVYKIYDDKKNSYIRTTSSMQLQWLIVRTCTSKVTANTNRFDGDDQTHLPWCGIIWCMKVVV